MSDVDLMARGGRFGNKADPFWQVVIDKGGIALNGAASPRKPESVNLAKVKPEVHGSKMTWLTEADGQRVVINSFFEPCVRDDGFRFLQKVRVTVGSRLFVGCGQRGDDPPPTKE